MIRKVRNGESWMWYEGRVRYDPFLDCTIVAVWPLSIVMRIAFVCQIVCVQKPGSIGMSFERAYIKGFRQGMERSAIDAEITAVAATTDMSRDEACLYVMRRHRINELLIQENS